MTDPLVELFVSIAGRKIEGGCDRCHAYQLVTILADGVASLITHHTDDCPTWRAAAARTN